MKVFFFFILLSSFHLEAAFIPRKVLALWDSKVDKNIENTVIHKTLEMPLNYVGLDVVYADIQKPLPSLEHHDHIRGILVSFGPLTRMRDPIAVIDWLIQGINQGIKVVLMNNRGFDVNEAGIFTSSDEINRLYEKLGIVSWEEWVDYPFEYKIISPKNALTPFEGEFPVLLPGFYKVSIDESYAKSYLTAGIPENPESESQLIIISPNGAYVSEFYANNWDEIIYINSPQLLQWYLNPFKFFELVFDTKGQPIPDPTTLAGKRIFFCTCHGDSWNITTQIEKYRIQGKLCSEVILDEIIKPHPDLPLSVAVVAADVDPEWVGKKISQEVAKKSFELPQVEPASHTYSHPFFWKFFKNGGKEQEIDYLYLYPYGSWQNSFLTWARAKFYQYFKPQEFKKKHLKWGYVIPRAYANKPFDLNLEISGSIDFLNRLAPENKKIPLLIWSGDSLPWGKPVELCYQANVQNFGGGFVRFDHLYSSNLFVYPLGRKPGGFIQPYTCANGENDYTNGWTDQFFAFKYLPITFERTENPRRLKPMVLYYHSYSGEFESSVKAILGNIDYIKSQKPIAITTVRFCKICSGFYQTEIEDLGSQKWRILQRGDLQTLRFDEPNLSVDFAQSIGVIGYTKHFDSLYVYLDKHVEAPVVSLKAQTENPFPFLIESNWEIWNFRREGENLVFQAEGWGKMEMKWNMGKEGAFRIEGGGKVARGLTKDGVLECALDLPFNQETSIKIIAEPGASL